MSSWIQAQFGFVDDSAQEVNEDVIIVMGVEENN